MATPARALTGGRRLGYRLLAAVSLALALAGTLLPLLPTTPFALVALWSAGRSSPALAERIRQHRILGPVIRDWHRAGSLSVGTRVLALLMLAVSAGMLWLLPAPAWARLVFAVVGGGVAVFVLTRPLPGRRS